MAIFAEALWDHVTMDETELAFQAGDVIEVTDTTDKNWWWGYLGEDEGWIPTQFIRVRFYFVIISIKGLAYVEGSGVSYVQNVHLF